MFRVLKKNKTSQATGRSGVTPGGRTQSCCRILVVDQNSDLRLLYSDALARPGCRVDVVADGEAAWAALQVHRYDLLITENEMPSLTGDGLLKKLLSARMELPVVIVAECLHPHETTLNSSRPRTATLWKPFALDALMDTVKGVLPTAVPILKLPPAPPATNNRQEGKQPRELLFRSPDNATRPIAVILSVRGKCDCCEDGAGFGKLERGRVLMQGAIVRTGQDARTDLLFQRTGTSVRLQASTEIRLEKMDVTFEDGQAIAYTLLDLRAGKIFTVVDSTVAGNTLEIRNATGRTVAEKSGVSKCIITADETHVWAEGSNMPIKVRGGRGSTIIAAGEHFAGRNGAMLPISNSSRIKDLIQLDELQAATQSFASEQSSIEP
ncbi:MAG TPA: response regulator [Verrucomicrobiae bacterium]|nr:response regulator [Verrucomicrobiae bacterium]